MKNSNSSVCLAKTTIAELNDLKHKLQVTSIDKVVLHMLKKYKPRK